MQNKTKIVKTLADIFLASIAHKILKTEYENLLATT